MYELMRRTIKAFLALVGVCALWLPMPAAAQDEPRPFTRAGTRSSQFPPPAKDAFVADEGPGLDTGCTFNTSANHPLVIDIMVDQAVGPVDGNGFLLNAAALIAEGVIPAKVDVTMPGFDVDVNGTPPPERDEVLLNGERLGLLTGADNTWKQNSFMVPVSKIKFPAPVASGSPAPRANRVQINVDTLSSGRWCTAIDWVALRIPIKPKMSFKLERTAGNVIRVRDYTLSRTIDVIYEQSFDADCKVKTDIGDGDFKEYPFSGPAATARQTAGLGPSNPGSARLHATLTRCPANDHVKPKVKVKWKITGTSLTGVSSWSGNEGDIDLFMPKAVGAYDVELIFTIDEKSYPAIHRKLFVTWTTPKLVPAPRVGWYEKAAGWAQGQISQGKILNALLAGEYAFGQAHWRYGYRFGALKKCTWQQLVQDPISCNYSDCFVFSDVFQNMAATLGIGGLSPVKPRGTHREGFLTWIAPSLDDAFPGNAKSIGSSTYDRYYFTNHSLRLKGSSYYDATFNGTYPSANTFVTANRNGLFDKSDADGLYAITDEGWKIYRRPGHVYASWGRYDYKPPTPVAPISAPVLQGPMSQPTSTTADLEFTGNATYNLLDENLDGIADALTADVEVRLHAAGEYTFLGTLEKAGQPIADGPAWESMIPVSADLDQISGTYTITLRFSGEQIYRSGMDGPYDLVLFGIAEDGFVTATLATPGHAHTQFGELPAGLTGVSEDAVDIDGDGKLEYIDVTLGLDVRLESELQLQGALDKDGQTLADAGTVQSLEAGARLVTLRFDAANIRSSGLDGPYDGSVNLIDADGNTIDGIRFTTRPYSAGSFSAPVIPQGPFTDQGVDTNANGLYDVLRIGFGAAIERAGSYRLTGVLRGAGSESAVFADSLLTVAAGSATIQLELSGPEINALGLDGPYTVDLLVRDAATLEDLDAVQLPQATAAYQASQFEPFGWSNQYIVLTGSSSDSGVDTNGNGHYDELHVDVEVALAHADFYEWSARLVDRNDTEIGFYTNRAALAAGVTNIHFVFDGETIGDNGVDGPYFVKGLLMFGQSGANLLSFDAAETRPYRVTEFEGAGDLVPPQILISTAPTTLWSPDHQYATVKVADFVLAVTDNRDPMSVADVVITRVTSDEADDANGGGDGKTVNDIVLGPGCRSADLRAERLGSGNGRVYTIHVAAADVSGNVGTATYQVTVPRDSSGNAAVDGGPAFTVEGCTP